MNYKVAGIDIHKKVLMVVVTDAAAEELTFESRRFGTGASEREHLVAWLQDRGAQEIVMESTAQYWKPIWLDLEPHFGHLHLAQAHSNRAPKGRKHDFADAQRLTRRLIAGELILSFVPGSEQRGWRTITRAKVQLVRDRSAARESTGSFAGGNADQVIQRRQRTVGLKRSTDSGRLGRRRKRPRRVSQAGGPPPAV